MQRSTLAKRVWLLLFLAVIACYFYALGRPALLGPDEPRYAQVAREMFMRGDPITPTLGGYTWFEKPSLLYWMMMASYGLFGTTEFAARFGPACAGILTALLLYWMGNRVERACEEREKPRGLGRWSSLAVATSAGLIIFSRGASFDIIITMTVTLALSCFFVSEIERDGRRRTWLLCGFYAAVGASLLAKGLVGIVIPFGVVGAYFTMRWQWPDRKVFLSLLWGLPLAIGIAAIWYWPVTARHGWTFIDDFFIQHHFARYVSNKYLHPQPFYFYLPVMLGLAFPWSAFLVAALIGVRRWKWRASDPLNKFQVFALAWLAVPVLFFSLSVSKLPGYVLPALPGALLLASFYLVKFLRGEKSLLAMRVTGALLLLLAIAGAIYGARTPEVVSTACLAFVVAPLLIAGVFLVLRAHLRRACALLLISAMLVATFAAAACIAERVGERESVRHLMQLATARGLSSAPVYGLWVTEHTAEFYAPGRVARGADHKPVRLEGGMQVLAEARQHNGSPILVLVPLDGTGELTKAAYLEIEIIGDNGSVALVAVRAR